MWLLRSSSSPIDARLRCHLLGAAVIVGLGVGEAQTGEQLAAPARIVNEVNNRAASPVRPLTIFVAAIGTSEEKVP